MSNLKGFDRTLTIILSIILIAAIVATIYIIVFPQPSEKFTEFYILGPDGKAGNYPDNLTAGQNGNLIIGIVNHESADATYILIVRFNQAKIRNDTISLKNNEKKEIPFTFTASNPGQNQRMEFLLYKLPNSTDVYRSLHLSVDVN
ncbi:MAG: DUF1616 domain-containing protein [Methanobacterium sp.]|nr:DUF1616 domain-containing protein [Methanobacterium sp.]